MEPMPGAVRRNDWFVMLDPRWQPSNPEESPPSWAMVGGWHLDADGKAGPFQPNPQYEPADDSAPTDPVDALLRLAVAGEDVADALIRTLGDSVLEIAGDEQNNLFVAPAPDGVRCVLVATAAVHKKRLPTTTWLPIVGNTLHNIVPDGLDILLNPGSPHQFRLITSALHRRETDS